ncbi:hypothetical protein ACROYT_G032930 [Oculina patagonica]
MYISLLWLVLSSICVRSWACVTDSDCSWTDVCCKSGDCISNNAKWFRCPCISSDECKRDERCYYGRCEPIPTVSLTTTTSARPTRDGDCKKDSDCEENYYCYRGRFGRWKSGYCNIKPRDLEEEERQKRKKDLERNLLNIGLPIGIPFLIMPCLVYFTLKYLNKRERRRYGIPYRSPARTPQRSQAGATGQPRNSQATELQTVSTSSSHNDRTVIEVEQLAPSAPQLPAPQNIPTEEVMESTEPEEQTDIAVSSETVIDNSSSLVPGAPPSYNEIRRLQNGGGEQPPPSYEEAIVNYNIARH